MSEARSECGNPLLETANEVFALVAPLRNGVDSARDYSALREDILEALQGMERKGLEHRLGLPEVEAARFAVTAYVDEAVINSRWEGKSNWMASPLQLELFGEQSAGQKFFDNLESLRRESEKNIDVLEVYCVCLQLGFEGAYAFKQPELLIAMQMDLQAQVESIRGLPEPRLSPEKLTFTQKVGRAGAKVPYWVIAAGTAAAIISMHFHFQSDTEEHVRVAAEEIREIQVDLFGRGQGR